jgi:hypothetical protein
MGRVEGFWAQAHSSLYFFPCFLFPFLFLNSNLNFKFGYEIPQ